MKSAVHGTFALLLGLVIDLPTTAQWVRARSPGFEFYTDVDVQTALQLAGQFQRVCVAFHQLGGVPNPSPVPVRIFLFSSEREFARYRPTPKTRGFFQSGPDRDYIVLVDSGAETLRVLLHEYVHLVLHRSLPRLPAWLEEGLAEFYSTLRLDGDQLVVGIPLSQHLSLLAKGSWLSDEELRTFRPVTADAAVQTRLDMFYAQSWALVHMLLTAPAYRHASSRFLERVAIGRPTPEAFLETFGKPWNEALRDLSRYVRHGSFPVLRVPCQAPPLQRLPVEPLTLQESALALVDLQLKLGRWEWPESTVNALARSSRYTAEVEYARGLVALARGQKDRARMHFERAIQLGIPNASAYFEYAMLLSEDGTQPRRVRELLERAIALNPAHADAHFLLGLAAERDGQLAEAIEHYQRATRILPRRTHFWHALALAYQKHGQRELAAHAAQRALMTAETEQEKAMAASVLRWIEQPGQTVTRPREGIPIPDAWRPPRGERTAEGFLEYISCEGERAWFRVRGVGGNTLLLLVERPDRVQIRGEAEPLSLACGHQPSVPVRVEFTPLQAGTASESAARGYLVALEFR